MNYEPQIMKYFFPLLSILIFLTWSCQSEQAPSEEEEAPAYNENGDILLPHPEEGKYD
jgi:hypothetical protein